jgi:hypothetical protein
MTRAFRGLLDRLRAYVRGTLARPLHEGERGGGAGALLPIGEGWNAARVARLERAGLLRPGRRPAR